MENDKRHATPRQCDCANGGECYGDYPPKGVKCRNLEPLDPGIDVIGPSASPYDASGTAEKEYPGE